MRRIDRQLEQDQALAVLDKGEYGTLGMIDTEGRPYQVPVNYGVFEGGLFFHCAAEGTKIDAIEVNPEVTFCVVGDTRVLPESFGTLYESCIVRGTVRESTGEEKQLALEGLIRKYSPGYIEAGRKYIDKLTARTRVFRVALDEVTGKARRS